MKTMEQFLNEITTDKELAEKLSQIKSEQELAEFLKANDVEGTAEEFKKFVVAKAKASGELSDEELEDVSGGMLFEQFFTLVKQIYNGIVG